MKTLISKLTTLTLLSTISFTAFGMQPEVKVLHAAQQAADIDGDIQMPQAPAAAQQAEAEEVAAPPLMVRIHRPPMLRLEEIDLHREEAISILSFKDNIEAQAKEGNDFILASVESRAANSHGERPIKYYDAYNLFRYFFAPHQPYPFNDIQDQLRQLVKADNSPLRDPEGNPIHDINFYTYDAQKPEQGFAFLCTWSQLCAANQNISGVPRDTFFANQNQNLQLKHQSLLNLGDFYRRKDAQKAIKFYTRLKDQNTDAFKQISASANLGRIYHTGKHGVTRDYKKALELLLPIAGQTILKSAQELALILLGDIYQHGDDGVATDYQKACMFYTQALNSDNPMIKIEGMFHLGELYFYKKYGMQDFAKAMEYLSPASRQSIHLETKIQAENILKDLAPYLQKLFPLVRRRAGVGVKNSPDHQHPAPEAGSEPAAKRARTEADNKEQ